MGSRFLYNTQYNLLSHPPLLFLSFHVPHSLTMLGTHNVGSLMHFHPPPCTFPLGFIFLIQFSGSPLWVFSLASVSLLFSSFLKCYFSFNLFSRASVRFCFTSFCHHIYYLYSEISAVPSFWPTSVSPSGFISSCSGYLHFMSGNQKWGISIIIPVYNQNFILYTKVCLSKNNNKSC